MTSRVKCVKWESEIVELQMGRGGGGLFLFAIQRDRNTHTQWGYWIMIHKRHFNGSFIHSLRFSCFNFRLLCRITAEEQKGNMGKWNSSRNETNCKPMNCTVSLLLRCHTEYQKGNKYPLKKDEKLISEKCLQFISGSIHHSAMWVQREKCEITSTYNSRKTFIVIKKKQVAIVYGFCKLRNRLHVFMYAQKKKRTVNLYFSETIT